MNSKIRVEITEELKESDPFYKTLFALRNKLTWTNGTIAKQTDSSTASVERWFRGAFAPNDSARQSVVRLGVDLGIISPLAVGDGELIRKYIGLHSHRHDEPFVRSGHNRQVEIWYTAALCLELPRAEAVRRLMDDQEITLEEAEAVWVYVSRNPTRAKWLTWRHTGAFDQELLSEPEIEEIQGEGIRYGSKTSVEELPVTADKSNLET